jgi:AraC family transcriptional regulator
MVLASGSGPGASGIEVLSTFYDGECHFEAQLRRHAVTFCSAGIVHCRWTGRALTHDAPEGSISIHPAGIDCCLDTDRSMRSILVLVDPAKLSLAAAEDSALDAQLIGRLNGFDEGLLTAARMLANELRNGYPRGTVYWNEAAGRFLSGLAARHTSGRKEDAADMFTAVTLKRVRDYIMAHLDEPLDVATLAAMCGRSQFHFSRVFARSVGVSPYQYVLHLRVKRAVQLICERRLALADIAYAVGFADQAHLTRWVRRVYGVTPTLLTR